MSMDSEDGFERGFARGWEAAMRKQADDAAQQSKVTAGEWLARQQIMEGQDQIRKMAGVRAGQ